MKSAERTVRIIEALAVSPGRLTISELQERVGYPRSSLHALVRTLRNLGWVEADKAGVAFGIGPRVLLSATAHLDYDRTMPCARHAIEDVRAELGFTVHYVRRAGAYVLGLATRDARGQIQADPMVRRWLPAYTSAVGGRC